MIKNKLKLVLLLPVIFLLSGCQFKDSFKEFIDKYKKSQTGEDASKEVVIKETETLEVSISCNQNTIKDYLNEGWTIVDSSSFEVACSWKTEKATKDCNEKLDKSCKIKVPDKIGVQTRYLLERETKD